MKIMSDTQASHLRNMQSLRSHHQALRAELTATRERLDDVLERAVQLMEGGS